jgi:hypothetical protein
VSRVRAGTFEPMLIAKGQKRFEGFDEKIIAMYARARFRMRIMNDEVALAVGDESFCDHVWRAIFSAGEPAAKGQQITDRNTKLRIRPIGPLYFASADTFQCRVDAFQTTVDAF